MIANGVEKVGVVGKYELDLDQRKQINPQFTGEWRKIISWDKLEYLAQGKANAIV